MAVGRAKEATNLARELRDKWIICSSHALRGWVQALCGDVRSLTEDFARATALKTHATDIDRLYDQLYLYPSTQCAELLCRAGLPDLAVGHVVENLRVSQSAGWNDKAAYCHWVLGVCALADGRLNEAEEELRQAEPVFHQGQVLFELARLHVTAGSLALARRNAATALRRAEEALALASPRGMRLVHADALVVRGRARLLEFSPSGRGAHASMIDSLARALDDADDALRLARESSYVWAERDALALQADTHAVLAETNDTAGNTSAVERHREAAHRTRADAEALGARLRLTEEDLAEADVQAAAWRKEWERVGFKKDISLLYFKGRAVSISPGEEVYDYGGS